jgi:hypothetical protein
MLRHVDLRLIEMRGGWMAGWSAVQQGSSLEGGLFNIPSLCGKAKCLAAVVWKLVLRFTIVLFGSGLNGNLAS